MKSGLPKPALAILAVLAVAALVFAFAKAGGDAAPQVDPKSLPDYSKMSPAEINAAHNAEPGNGPGRPAADGKGRG